MALLIRNGEIVTASERYVADIYCEGETIARIGRELAAPPSPTWARSSPPPTATAC